MYDTGKVITGILIFVIFFTFPFLYNLASGKGSFDPNPVAPKGKDKCVKETEYMTSFHMDLVNEWREKVVRQGERNFVALDGKEYEMSLTKTCLKCHSNKSDFCDKCHNYLDVDPYCWDCHVVPKEEK